jgi:CRP-like cAMP-binding protein
MVGNVMSVSPGPDLMAVVAAPACASKVRELVAGDVLFRPRELRTQLYIIESGMIALCRNQLDQSQEIIEFAFTDDVVGLGFLNHHMYWATALSKSRLRSLPLSALDELLQNSERTRHRYGQAVERDFLARREELIATFCGNSVKRVASLFLALSQLNRHEGRDASLIVDSLACGTVSNCLGLDLNSLGRALVELERSQLIKATPGGLRLINLAGLEALIMAQSNHAPDPNLQKEQNSCRSEVSSSSSSSFSCSVALAAASAAMATASVTAVSVSSAPS